ncbi:MAG: SUMF1/EgtB/PvdO family nonheme iron enzyme [Kiritimatiellae bacterium]|nr:SUMF1/EgtB/PvdO family nonheme iron enzyme [Kiritimatiellia bacterium]
MRLSIPVLLKIVATRHSRMPGILFFAVLSLLLMQSSFAATWYVDVANGSDENVGTSWETALASIQKGIDSAVAHDTILVSRGIYSYIDIPTSKIGLTVLAMSGPTDTIIKGATKRRCVTIGDGSVTNIYVEGFTLTAGHLSDSSVAGAGALGGTYNNCVIAGNNCGSLAGGAGAANCTLNGCTISNNIASSTLAGTGGIVNCIASNCVISSNISKGSGSGGADGCTLIECTIIGNKANVSRSGGAYNCTLYRCLLEDNTCTSVDFAGRDMNGGKAYNCIIKANKGSRSIVGANCYNCTIISTTGNPSIWRDTQLYNCIICSTGNAFAIDGDSNWKVNLYNCLLHNVTLGTHTTQSGCLSADPIFISASNLALQSMSPCIDNGNNLYAASGDTDVAGKPRVNGGTVDIGAYEYYPVELSLKDITAKQRYPWNGKVDVEFKLETSDSNNCVVMLFAKDVAGGTNLPMRTVYKQDGTAVNMAGESLVPGTYNWVWDAAADLPDGFECERVSVEVTANNNPLYMVIDLSGGANASSYPVSYLNAVPDGGWTDEYKTTKLVLRRIEPGTFTMDGYGSSNTHKVTLTKAYYIGIFEVTQAQYLRVMGVNPSYHVSSGEASPVEDVYWTDLRGAATGIQFPSDTSCDSSSFFGIMRSRTSLSFLDLPTEAQWQYACMGNGTLGGVAESGTTRIVGTKSANGLGLYDMQGNVDEWMIDLWKEYGTGDCIDPEGGTSGTVRIIKGGYYGQTGSDPCNKVGFRCNENQACRHQYTGFRVCMTLR